MSKIPEVAMNRRFIALSKQLNMYLNHFPRDEKFALCNRIRNTSYELFDLITECNKRHFKKTTITQLDVTHERLRMQVYLARELGYFQFKDGKNQNTQKEGDRKYAVIENMINELGRMIGGWIKKEKQKGNL
jgi:hypothetical protein